MKRPAEKCCKSIEIGDMLRKEFVDKYNDEMVEAFSELFNTARKKMFHSGDLLLCQQNGTMFGKDTVIGLGEEGLNSLQQINALYYNGIGKMTEDNDYFKKHGNDFFHGTSELELSIQAEMKAYKEIWENVYFLRVLTEVVRVVNGERYDWQLDMYKLGNNKSNHIRDKIIKKLDACPKFREAMKTAYRRQIRNAEAHSQYQIIQGGIWFDNYKKVNADEVQGICFDEWERIYCYSYLIFKGILDHLKSIVQQLYFPATLITQTGGIPILCYYYNGTWGEAYIYPDKTGKTWRFQKQI